MSHINSAFVIPPDTWALSDSGEGDSPCPVFKQQLPHIIHTSSPASGRWQMWVKTLAARIYIMDVWSDDEFQMLLYVVLSSTSLVLHSRIGPSVILNFNVERGMALFQKYGSNIRTIVKTLLFPELEAAHIRDVETAAYAIAQDFATIIVNLKMLYLGLEGSCKVFTIRPEKLGTTRLPVLYISSSFLASTLGMAVARHATAQKHLFFVILNSHPTLRAPAGWLFENYSHFYFSIENRRESIHGYLKDDPNRYLIPIAKKMLSGTTALKRIQQPFNFYWRPTEPTFKGINSVLRLDNTAWVFQFTISNEHHPATEGLDELYKIMNHKRNLSWKLIIVGPEQEAADQVRDAQNLSGRWANTPVYACKLAFGAFPDPGVMQQFQASWDEVSCICNDCGINTAYIHKLYQQAKKTYPRNHGSIP